MENRTYFLEFEHDRGNRVDTGYAAYSDKSRCWWACGNRGNAVVFASYESARCAMAEAAHDVKGVPPDCWRVTTLVSGGQTVPATA